MYIYLTNGTLNVNRGHNISSLVALFVFGVSLPSPVSLLCMFMADTSFQKPVTRHPCSTTSLLTGHRERHEALLLHLLKTVVFSFCPENPVLYTFLCFFVLFFCILYDTHF